MALAQQARRIPLLVNAALPALLVVLLAAVAFAQDGCRDFDEDGICYQPLLCSSVSECECTASATKKECGICPNDKGSSFKDEDVCWCETPDTLNPEGVECNPRKRGGPRSCESDDGCKLSSPGPTTAASTTVAATTEASTSTSTSTSTKKGTLPIAAIPGGVVGGVLALMTLLACLLWKRKDEHKKQRKKRQGEEIPRLSAPGTPSGPNVGSPKVVAKPPEETQTLPPKNSEKMLLDTRSPPWALPPLPDGPPPVDPAPEQPEWAEPPLTATAEPPLPPLPLAPPDSTTPPPPRRSPHDYWITASEV